MKIPSVLVLFNFFGNTIILIMIIIEIQYSGIALLLVVNPCILYQNNVTAPQLQGLYKKFTYGSPL